MDTIVIEGLDPEALVAARTSGIDHGGNRIAPFPADDEPWALRCCLTDSAPGQMIATVAWSPFGAGFSGAYRETGPVVIHTDTCPSSHDGSFPEHFELRRQLVRPYNHADMIAYDHCVAVDPGDGLHDTLKRLLGRADIAFVHVRNPLANCYSFTARRAA